MLLAGPEGFYSLRQRELLSDEPAYEASAARFSNAEFAAVMNRRIMAGDFVPGEDSTPLATSTAAGCTMSMAAATFSGVSPPASTSGGMAGIS